MSLRVLLGKLRKKNKGDYRQFEFSTAFAVMLISSYLMLISSPLIRGALPEGGDSSKQMYVIFGVAAVGCIVFVLYVTRLFLRYKSREIGIFMALGAEKHILANALSAEIARMSAVCSALGILAGAAVSFAVGQIIEVLIREVYDGEFVFTMSGLLLSAGYAVLLFLITQFQARRAMRRTNIIEVINEQRRQEPMRRSVSKAYLISGIVLTAGGLACALLLNRIVVYTTGVFLGSWTNFFYIAAVFGIYRVLVYTVSSRRRGRNPQKYYNNLIDFGMMKFQGASVVRNMLVITLLLFGGMYAISYLPSNLSSGSAQKGYEDEFSYRFLDDAEELVQLDVFELAGEFGVSVEDYKEGTFARVYGSGTERDMGEDNLLTEEYMERYSLYDVTSASEYEKLTGVETDITQGQYCQMTGSTSYENIWFSYGDMDKLYIEAEDTYLPLQYAGNLEYESLNISGDNGMGDAARFVVSDEDFNRLTRGLEKSRMETQVLFSTEGEKRDEIAFAEELFRRIAVGMSPDMDVMAYYNAVKAESEGEVYIRDYAEAVVDPDNALKETDWQFAPLLVPIVDQQRMMLLITRILMFVYIFIICMAAAGVIGYTRSQNVGLTNAQVFEDIRRLGADDRYRRTLLLRQLRKVFLLPTVLGVGICLGYQSVILWGNDGRFSFGDAATVFLLALIGAGIALYQYIVYRMSVKKTAGLLKL